MKYTFFFFVVLLSCNDQPAEYKINILVQNSGTRASLRGLAVVDENTAWASGSGGTVLRTIDGGKNWQDVSLANADSLDFRDIEAFSANEAIVLNAGFPGVIYKTMDGGGSWQLVHEDLRPEIFFDAMGFWNSSSGIAFGDAIDGKLVIVTTNDGGNSWQAVEDAAIPTALKGEGGFAASGTCLTTLGDSSVWIALGVPESRIFYSSNRGQSWQVFPTAMAQPAPGAGIFSLSFSSPDYGIAVGGNYEIPDDTTKVITLTDDGGKSWELLHSSGINGYKSAIANIPDSDLWLSTGPTGVSYSSDNGLSWSLIDSIGYHSLIILADSSGWLSGANGKISKIKIEKTKP